MNSEQADNTSSAFDRELNEALVNANIAKGYEEFLALFDRFYAEQVEVANDGHATARGESARAPRPFQFSRAAPCDGRDRRSRRYTSVFHAS